VHQANVAQLALATGWTIEYILNLGLNWQSVMLDVMRFNDEKVKIKPH
jgi:hypothetical protein